MVLIGLNVLPTVFDVATEPPANDAAVFTNVNINEPVAETCVDDHITIELFIFANTPVLEALEPAPLALNLLVLVAPVFGEFQYKVPSSFIYPPATELPPKYVCNVINCSLVGIAHPSAHIFLASVAAYQL